tara:strand:+ start:410 stop:1006 length:597 start_codon:yes stop_codon:yes gene_type:complete
MAMESIKKIVKRSIDDLIFAEYNPRQLSKEQFKYLKDSIHRFGLVDPIIINKNKDRKNIIIGGHQRTKVAKAMGIKEIPCIELDLNYDKEKELNIRLNKNTADWDYDLLANNFDIEELSDWGFDDDDLKLFDADYGEDFDLPDGDKEPFRQVTFTLSDEQYEVVENALKKAKKNDFGETGNENSNGNALWWVCNSYEG